VQTDEGISSLKITQHIRKLAKKTLHQSLIDNNTCTNTPTITQDLNKLKYKVKYKGMQLLGSSHGKDRQITISMAAYQAGGTIHLKGRITCHIMGGQLTFKRQLTFQE